MLLFRENTLTYVLQLVTSWYICTVLFHEKNVFIKIGKIFFFFLRSQVYFNKPENEALTDSSRNGLNDLRNDIIFPVMKSNLHIYLNL